MRFIRTLQLAVCEALIATSAFAAEVAASAEMDEVDLTLPSLWDHSFNVRTSAGYKDNVLLSANLPVDSPFLAGGFDAMSFRLPEDGWDCLIFASGDYTHYTRSEDVDDETSLLTQAQVKKELAGGWKPGFSAEYLYFDQVFDNSVFDFETTAIKIRGHTFTGRPSVHRDFLKSAFFDLEFPVSRQLFEDSTDDEWQAGPGLTLGHRYGTNSEVTAGFRFLNRNFDTRDQRDAEGNDLPGESLEFLQSEYSIGHKHHWDARRRWRTTTRLSLMRTDDNGPGFYDYWRPRAALQLRYQTERWQVRFDARFSHYDYDLQLADPPSTDTRYKDLVESGVRIERSIVGKLKIFAEYTYERSFANVQLDTYTANTAFGGLDWEF